MGTKLSEIKLSIDSNPYHRYSTQLNLVMNYEISQREMAFIYFFEIFVVGNYLVDFSKACPNNRIRQSEKASL